MFNVGMKDLEQYNVLDKEIKTLEQELIKIFKDTTIESDIVTGSALEFPYTKASFQITGDDKKTTKKIEQFKKIIKNRRTTLLDKRLTIETFINSVEDSDIRLIIHLKYIKGFTWLEVSNHVYGYPSKDRARIKLERYLRK